MTGRRDTDPVSESQRRLLEQIGRLNDVAVDLERVAVLLQALGAILDRGEGWEELSASYAASPRVPALRWPDGQLEREWVGREMRAVVEMLERLQLMASLAVLQEPR